MMMLVTLVSLVPELTHAQGGLADNLSASACVGVYYHGLGCFIGSYPYTNTPELPQEPDFINTLFHLYTRSNTISPQILV
jgi:hypothetical protein